MVNYFRTFGARPIAMSKFGQRALGEFGLDAHYVPHGIDTDAFKPMDSMAQAVERSKKLEESMLIIIDVPERGRPLTVL